MMSSGRLVPYRYIGRGRRRRREGENGEGRKEACSHSSQPWLLGGVLSTLSGFSEVDQEKKENMKEEGIAVPS